MPNYFIYFLILVSFFSGVVFLFAQKANLRSQKSWPSLYFFFWGKQEIIEETKKRPFFVYLGKNPRKKVTVTNQIFINKIFVKITQRNQNKEILNYINKI